MTAVDVTDLTLDGPHGPLPVRVYRADARAAGLAPAPASAPAPALTPGLVWCHGGAFVHGSLDMPEGDWVARELAARGITVVSVDYQLAPRAPGEGMPLPEGTVTAGRGPRFPVPSHEVEFALVWTRENAANLGIDPARVGLGGASAGGNLAAGVGLRLATLASGTASGTAAEPSGHAAHPRVGASYSDHPTAPPALLVLAYPTLHANQPPLAPELRAAIIAAGHTAHLSPTLAQGMYENYLDCSTAELDAAPFDAVPGLAGPADLAALPPVVMVNSEADGLRASADAFAATLTEAGVTVSSRFEPGTGHGHLNTPDHPGATLTLESFAAALHAL